MVPHFGFWFLTGMHVVPATISVSGEILASKQLRANTGKSKYVMIGAPQSRIELLYEAEKNPIMIGEHKQEA